MCSKCLVVGTNFGRQNLRNVEEYLITIQLARYLMHTLLGGDYTVSSLPKHPRVLWRVIK